MWKRLSALPPYPGGKRKLLGEIFKHLPPPAEAPVLVDAFLGGGSVSLYSKARGYRVVCNDIALRSQIVGEALIANGRITLATEDVTRLFMENGNTSRFVEDNFAPSVVTTKHAQFLDIALANIGETAGTKRWLLMLLLLKYILRQRPMGNFGARTIVEQAERGEWEEMNPHYLKDMVLRGVADHPRRVAEVLRPLINRGVFANGHDNEVHRGDVFEFLENIEGDILYLDPPYSGTSAYERALKPLDSILEGRLLTEKPSAFSGAGGPDMLDQLLGAASHFPVWVLSYGNVDTDLAGLVRRVEQHRPVTVAEEFRYTHLTGLASDEHKERNRELLIIARR